MICEALRGAKRYVFTSHNSAAMGDASEYSSRFVRNAFLIERQAPHPDNSQAAALDRRETDTAISRG